MKLNITPVAALLAAVGGITPLASAQIDMSWNTFDGGGGISAGGAITIHGSIGQPDAGESTGGAISLRGGFWAGAGGAPPCYANCDLSTSPPILNVNDFICFNNRYAAGESYANCDASTNPPILNVNDFICFTNAFAVGCP